MRKCQSVALGLGVAALILAVPSAARAQCSTFAASITDGRISGPWSISSGNGLSWDFGISAGHSYSVEVLDRGGSSVYTMVVGNGFCPTANIAGLRDTTLIDPTSGTTFTCCFVRKSFTAAANGFLEVAVTTAATTAFPVDLSVTETTMFSPAWSTNGTFDTFYSFQNTTNATCNIALTMKDTSGAVQTTSSNAVSGQATFSTNSISLATPRNKTGTATLTHDCPPGGILAVAAIANFTLSPTPYFQDVKFLPVRAAH